ncbi:hypothetical protein AB0L82_01885 [Nocardia sp. NPDC052001]|uniref:hypothetical protein n=1 Tax=Nocardia sp. NPDC052001 TaxID=3154853 RepID=UPI0034303450
MCTTTQPPEKCPDGSVKPAGGKCETGGGNPNPGGGNPNPGGGKPNPPVTTPPPTEDPGQSVVPQPNPDTQPPNPETPKPAGSNDVFPANSGLSLNPVAVSPGASVTVTGRGCDANANVKLSIGGVGAGDTRARADGGFDATLPTGATEIGQHQVTAECGPKLAADLDVVLVSQVGGDAGTATVLLFFLLIGGWFLGHRLVSHLPARRPR